MTQRQAGEQIKFIFSRQDTAPDFHPVEYEKIG